MNDQQLLGGFFAKVIKSFYKFNNFFYYLKTKIINLDIFIFYFFKTKKIIFNFIKGKYFF